jgi:uncharacterized protein YdbL (DUF1318 family)
MDISMRLDIYQHVQNDIDTIENLVSGQPKAEDKQSSLNLFVSYAYAEEGMSPQVEQAALRRKDRLAELSSWQAKGVIGENKSALVEIRDPQNADSNASQIVSQENADRMVIYQSIAQRNGTSVAEVQKLYAARLQASVPSGTPIQTQEGAWKVK